MGVYGGGQNIVTDGLVFYVDAANKESHTSGSTMIYDMVGNLDGELFNGAHTSDNNSIYLDGSDDRINIASSSLWGLNETTTLNLWFKKLSYSGWLLGFRKGSWVGWWIDSNSAGGFGFSGQDGSNDTTPNFGTTYINQWYNYTLVVDRENLLWKTYKNGSFIGSNSINHPGAGTYVLNVGYRLQGNSNYANMELGSLSAYNKVLTDDEVLQNYNALKGRFGL